MWSISFAGTDFTDRRRWRMAELSALRLLST
jgi:hypothetical protein